MTVKPDKSYFIDWKPQHGDEVDLVTRVKDGVTQALRDGFNEVYIIEDDDFYPPDYFEKMQLGNADFAGQNYTWYYNLRNKTYTKFTHPVRSSLFCTGFKISAIKDFVWPARTERFLDITLWRYTHNRSGGNKRKFVDTGAVGIKHGVGLCGGRGHIKTLKNFDKDMRWLKENVSSDAFTFYSSLNL